MVVAPLRRTKAWQVADSLLDSFRYAGMGFWYACRTQRNFRIHLCVSAIAIGSSLWLHLSAVEMALVSLTCGLVVILELLNTALEAVVDLTVGERYHALAKIAKDCAAAAVLVAAVVSVLVAAFLLLPPLMQRMGRL
nr:diacylglycerol kinase family protein [Synechococcus sp. PCC 7336]